MPSLMIHLMAALAATAPTGPAVHEGRLGQQRAYSPEWALRLHACTQTASGSSNPAVRGCSLRTCADAHCFEQAGGGQRVAEPSSDVGGHGHELVRPAGKDGQGWPMTLAWDSMAINECWQGLVLGWHAVHCPPLPRTHK